MRLLLSVFLATSTGLAIGCKREPDEAAIEQHAITAEVVVAPMADDDPWVIAFLTEISLSPPLDADARLEGRDGPGGLRHPDPIIEGVTREALEGALAAYEATHPRRPDLVPVWEFQPFGPEERVQWRLYFIDRARGFVVDDQGRAGIVPHEYGPAVHVYLSDAQRVVFEELTRELVGKRFGVTVDGELIMLPVVAEPIPTGNLQLSYRRRENPDVTAPALLARLRGQ